MFGIFEELLREMSGRVVEGLNQIMRYQIDFMFYAERHVPIHGISGLLSGAIRISSAFALSLLVLYFLKKGFDTYVLWSAGDADQDAGTLLVRFVSALGVISLFPVLYGYLAKETADLATRIATKLTGDGSTMPQFLFPALSGSIGFLESILLLIAAIMFFLLFLQFFKKGLELIVLRIGLPIAACGLLSADGGAFPAYLQMFIKAALTTFVQLVLFRLFLALIAGGTLDVTSLVWAIAALSLSLKTPQLIQQFIIPTARGSGGAVMGSMFRLASLLRRR